MKGASSLVRELRAYMPCGITKKKKYEETTKKIEESVRILKNQGWCGVDGNC